MSQNSPTLLPSRETGASPSCLTDHRHPLYAVQAVHHGGCLGDRSRQLWRPDRQGFPIIKIILSILQNAT